MKPNPVSFRKKVSSGHSNETTASTSRSSSKDSPPPKAPTPSTEEALSYYLRTSLPPDRLAERREIIDAIERATRQGDTHLDLQHVAAGALKAVPGAVLKALAGQVTGVTLPSGLDALPRCLNRLRGLRSIDVAGFTARQMDVTRWQLDTLRVAGRTALRWIAANEATSVSCPAPGIGRKVCVNVYRDGNLLGHTAAGSRAYIKLPSRRDYSINGAFRMLDGERAVCRHITQWWFGARTTRRAGKQMGDISPASDMYAVLNAPRAFRQALGHDAGVKYSDALDNATRNILVGNDRLGAFVKDEFRQMVKDGLPAIRQFHVTSIIHAMALELVAKEGQRGKPEYSLAFFDPNVSTTHVRIKFNDVREAGDLSWTGLFAQPDFGALYFKDRIPLVSLIDLDSIQAGKKRSLKLMLSDRESHCRLAIDLAIFMKFEATAQKLIDGLRALPAGAVNWKAFFLPTESRQYLSPLFMAVDLQMPRVAGDLLKLAITLTAEGALDRGSLLQLLGASISPDYTGTALSLACESSGCESITLLTDALAQPAADGLLSAAEYEALLENGGAGMPSPYAVALHQDDCGHVVALIHGMLRLTRKHRIEPDQFVRLVACHDSHGMPAIKAAFEQGNLELMQAVMGLLASAETAGFNRWHCRTMLAAADGDGTPALRATYAARHAAFLARYGRLVLSAVATERIEPTDGIRLLLASKPDEAPFEAFESMRPQGEMLVTLDALLHDVRVAHWLPDDLSEALDTLLTEDPSSTLPSDSDSELSSLG